MDFRSFSAFVYFWGHSEAPGWLDVLGFTGRPGAQTLISWLSHHRRRPKHPSSSPRAPPQALRVLLQHSPAGPGRARAPLLLSGPYPPTPVQVEAPTACSGALAAGAGCPPARGGSADPDEDTLRGAGGGAAAAGGAAGTGAGAAAEADSGGTAPNLAWTGS